MGNNNTKRVPEMSAEDKRREDINRMIEQGNVKSINDALIRGANILRAKVGVHFPYPLVVSNEQEASVRDFLSQHFATAIMEAEADDDVKTAEKLKALWEKITGRATG